MKSKTHTKLKGQRLLPEARCYTALSRLLLAAANTSVIVGNCNLHRFKGSGKMITRALTELDKETYAAQQFLAQYNADLRQDADSAASNVK